MQKKHVNDQQNNQSSEEQVPEAEGETFDFSKPDFTFLPNGHHSYRQQGPYLVCKSCEVQHATFIGIDKIMTGENNHGEPILKKRNEIR